MDRFKAATKAKFLLWILMVSIPVKSFAETTYDQPYLGEFPKFLRDSVSALALKKNAESNLAALVRQSDLIVLAESVKIKEAADKNGRITNYDANVKILRVFKGEPTDKFLDVNFQASATGIGTGSRHIFFLKRTKDNIKVLKASFIFPRGQGYDNHMRVIGAYDCSEDVGTDVINYLAGSTSAKNLEERLAEEYLSESWGKIYSAVYMASATSPVFGVPVLKMAVSVKDRKRFDIGVYGMAAYSLALQNKREYWKLILENVPSFPSYGRVPESIAFDLAANLGDEGTVFVIKAVVVNKPELAVSAAFALSKIGGEEARSVIESWVKNPELSGREEKISNGWMQRTASFSTLFEEALMKIKPLPNRKVLAH